MARIRTIKPEFFTSEDIVSISPMARLLYIALWCDADREGRLRWKPRTFKMRYFPADDCDVQAMCDEIVNAGLVKLYGDGLAYVPQFLKHQHINPRESASTLPNPDACPTRADASVTHRGECIERECIKREGDNTRQRRDGAAHLTPKPPQAAATGKRSHQPKTKADPEGFATFWAAWPASSRKAERKACATKWQSEHLGEQLAAILAHVDAMKRTRAWREGFEPAPLKYLKAEGWAEGLPPAERGRGGAPAFLEDDHDFGADS